MVVSVEYEGDGSNNTADGKSAGINKQINKDKIGMPNVPKGAETTSLGRRLPSFLTKEILTHLRGASTSELWQRLMEEYLEFEKDGPVVGVRHHLSGSRRNILI